MIRVAFLLENHNWMGGVNYLRNLLSALALLPEAKIVPVLFVGTKTPIDIINNFEKIEIIQTKFLDSGSIFSFIRKAINKLFGRKDPLFAIYLACNKIRVLSHSGPLWQLCNVKTIGWIGDFQHIHLPHFFSDKELEFRNKIFYEICNSCNCVLVSSKTALKDLESFDPSSISKSAVLQFVPEIDLRYEILSLSQLKRKYKIPDQYFYLPNQFWKHKNHKVVIEALAVLLERNIYTTIVLTGNKDDYRHPDHYEQLIAYAKRLKVLKYFKQLGIVPYADVLSLMHHSIAVINPSLFEGWSSTVEEAKALNKLILLSDLPVHIEQNPVNRVFFPPSDSQALSSVMNNILIENLQLQTDHQVINLSETYYLERIIFAEKYQSIVLNLV
jgi:glycosyltransferase involved in cell wall biosynthesis